MCRQMSAPGRYWVSSGSVVALTIMRGFIVLLSILAWVLPAYGVQQPSLVVAVDSSRSLRPSDIEAIHDALSRGLEGVSERLPIGLVTFDDTARWIVETTLDRESFLDALRLVEPDGTTTVLYDGIFLAALGMEGGGALMVVSDGKDENSAVTVSDIEGVCARQGVRLLTVAVGRTIDDKALRRLALLTRGAYLGPSVGSMPEGLPEVLSTMIVPQESGLKMTEDHEASSVGPAPAPITEEPIEMEAPVAATDISWSRMVVLGLLGLAGLAAIGVMLWGLTRRRSDRCPVCGAVLDGGGEECTACQIESIRTSAESREVAKEEATRVPDLGAGAMAFETRADDIQQTVALGEVAVLTVREEGREAREYTLPRDRIFAVGRAPKVNTLQVRDHTVSAQHFKVVYKESRYYVVDLWTTNGTSVNNECVRVHPLSPGDVIRAGLSEFVFSSKGEVAPKAGAKTTPPPLRKESSK